MSLNYRGQELAVKTGQDVRDVMQLLLTDLGELRQRMAAKDAQDGNRDRWLQQFASWVGGQVQRLSNGSGGAAPLSLLSMFSAKSKALTLPTTQTTTPAASPISPHRVPGPTAASLATTLATIPVNATSTDRAHVMTLDFTAAFDGTTNVGEVTFKAPYTSAPVVSIGQLDALTNRNFRVVSVTPTGYVFTCDAFVAAELHQVQAIVAHPTDSFD